MMRLLIFVSAAHGLLHLLGAAKGFRLAPLAQITQPISTFGATLWLAAAVLFLGTSIALSVWPRGWWAIAAVAVALSVFVIVPSWRDAKFGMLPNVLILAGVVMGFMSEGPLSLHAHYERDVRERAAPATGMRIIADADLVHLPGPVRRFLHLAGVVGQPRVREFLVRMHGRIRRDRDSPWMPFVAEQQNFVDVKARFFYMTSSMFSIPVQGYHRYADGSANMRVKAGGLVTVAGAAGKEMTVAETVTLFNDMSIMAPATLIDPGIAWETISQRRVRATFTNGSVAIHADLIFSDSGELVNFISDDRYQTAADDSAPRKLRWSTPIGDYRTFGSVRLASTGAGRWHDSDGGFSYIELTIDDVVYNVNR